MWMWGIKYQDRRRTKQTMNDVGEINGSRRNGIRSSDVSQSENVLTVLVSCRIHFVSSRITHVWCCRFVLSGLNKTGYTVSRSDRPETPIIPCDLKDFTESIEPMTVICLSVREHRCLEINIDMRTEHTNIQRIICFWCRLTIIVPRGKWIY